MSLFNETKLPHFLLVRLMAVYNTLKTAEKKAADLLLRNPELVVSSSITQASQEAGCSQPTYMRLARKLGFKGYTEFKAALNEGMASAETPYPNVIPGGEPMNTLKEVFRASIQTLHDTMEIVETDQFNRACEALQKAPHMALLGTGDAATIANAGACKFARIGVDCYFTADPDMQLIYTSHLKEGDVCILISHSGRTITTINAAKQAKSSGATTICVTNYPLSPLAKICDVVLTTAAFAKQSDGEVITKRIAALCLLEALYVNVLLEGDTQFKQNLMISNLSLTPNKQKPTGFQAAQQMID